MKLFLMTFSLISFLIMGVTVVHLSIIGGAYFIETGVHSPVITLKIGVLYIGIVACAYLAYLAEKH